MKLLADLRSFLFGEREIFDFSLSLWVTAIYSLRRMHKETIKRPSHARSFRGSCCSSKMSKWKAQACGGVGESEGSVGRLGGLRLAKGNSVRGQGGCSFRRGGVCFAGSLVLWGCLLRISVYL